MPALQRPRHLRAICLFSGGLDSQLSVCMLREQGVEVIAMIFRSLFFEAEKSVAAAKALNIPVIVEDFGGDILRLLHAPPHGFGKAMNPCIDCHAGMVRRAGQWMQANSFNFIATGEVLNQRPMSQNRKALNLVANGSGFAAYLLRPLSARLLPETEPERLGWVIRERLGNIHGRSRKPQIELARRYGLNSYPQASGGCLLTDSMFALRLRDVLEHEGMNEREISLLRFGRRFRVNGHRLILGRNSADNAALEKHAGADDVVMSVEGFPGPIGLAPAVAQLETLRIMVGICARYSDAPAGRPVFARLNGGASNGLTMEVFPADPETVEKYRI